MEKDICSLNFRQVMAERMKRAWARVHEAEKRGEYVDFKKFGQFIHEACQEVKKEMEKCPVRRW
jgi:hypothetical protein